MKHDWNYRRCKGGCWFWRKAGRKRIPYRERYRSNWMQDEEDGWHSTLCNRRYVVRKTVYYDGTNRVFLRTGQIGLSAFHSPSKIVIHFGGFSTVLPRSVVKLAC